MTSFAIVAAKTTVKEISNSPDIPVDKHFFLTLRGYLNEAEERIYIPNSLGKIAELCKIELDALASSGGYQEEEDFKAACPTVAVLNWVLSKALMPPFGYVPWTMFQDQESFVSMLAGLVNNSDNPYFYYRNTDNEEFYEKFVRPFLEKFGGSRY